jgi:hypothetical protein
MIEKEYLIKDGDDMSHLFKVLPMHAKFVLDIIYSGYPGIDQAISYFLPRFVWEEEEDDHSYGISLMYYEEELEKYNKWYERNKENIEYTLRIYEGMGINWESL